MIINPVVSGVQLPELTTPAGSGQILSGYQAINEDGEVLTGTIASRGAQTITPGTSNQTIAAGQYLSGTQTIVGDSDLVAGNIKSGVNIFGVTGNYSGGQVQIAGIPLDNVSWDSRYVYINLPNPISTLCGLNLLGKYADNLDPEGRNYSVIFVYPAFEITGQSPVWKEGYVQKYTSYYDDWDSQPNNYISYSTDVIRINSNQLRIRSDIASKLVELYPHTLLYSYIPA